MFKLLLQYSYILEVALCLALLTVLTSRSLVRNYKVLAILLLTRLSNRVLLIGLLFHRKSLGLTVEQDIKILLQQGWITGLLEGALVFILIYTTFWEAMRPLEGLHNIGKVIFRWVTGVSVAFAAAVALGPHELGTVAGETLPSRFDDGISVLTLCLLLFVCFAIRPLGLTYRSRIFGISLGLGVMTSIDLMQSGWLVVSGAKSIYSPVYLFSSVGSVVGLCIWLGYLVFPEPERMMILLPTTSPFFFWNRVSEALGDEPGFVAVGGIKPQMFNPAELKVMSSSHKHDSAEEAVAELAENPALPSVASR